MSQTVDTSALKKAFPEIFLGDAWHVALLAGDASSRRYFRLASEDGRSTYILQCADPFKDPQTNPFLLAQRILAKLKIPVPKMSGVFASYGWILQEDLGDATLQINPNEQLYREALRVMVEWNAEARQNNALLGDECEAPQFKWAFDSEKLLFEMNYTAEHLVTKYLGVKADEFLSEITPLCHYLSARPRHFCHRDYHSRNIMVANNHIYVIDFQDARMGPLTYDLVSLLWDPYVRLSENLRQKYLAFAKEQFGQKAGLSIEEEELEKMKIQRLLKAAGSYASFLNLKGRRDYLPSIAPALEDSAKAAKKIGANKLTSVIERLIEINSTK